MSIANRSPPRPRLVMVEPAFLSSSDSDTSPVIPSVAAFPPRPPMQRTKGFRGEPQTDDSTIVPLEVDDAAAALPAPPSASHRALCLALARVVADILLICYVLYSMIALSRHSPGEMQIACRGPLVWQGLAAQIALFWVGCLSYVVRSRCPRSRSLAAVPVLCMAIPSWALAEASAACDDIGVLAATGAPDGCAAHLRLLRGMTVGWASMIIPSLAAAAVIVWRKKAC